MAVCITLFKIRVLHDYFLDGYCRALSFTPTSASMLLMRRRGLLFRQNSLSEWSVLCETGLTGFSEPEDELVFEVRFLDRNFAYYTKMEAYDVESDYTLSAFCGGVDVMDSLKKEAGKKRDGIFFSCHVLLTDVLLEMAKAGDENMVELLFQSKSYYWEYFFLLGENGKKGDSFKLVESDGRLSFEGAVMVPFPWNSQIMALKVVSLQPIGLRERYDYRLSLLEFKQNSPSRGRVWMRNVECPVPGRYVSSVCRDDYMVAVVYL